MLCGTVPFKAPNLPELHKLILKGDFDYPVDISENSKDLINKMLVVKPKDRLTFPEILAHPWMKEGEEESSDESEEEEDEELKRVKKAWEEEEIKTNPNINVVNLDHLFTNFKTKLSYADYQSVAEEFMSTHIEDEAIAVVSTFGFPKEFVKESLIKGELNHSTACYNLIAHN
jgi:serine/threonine protein kinase